MPRPAEAGSGLSGTKPWLGKEDWLELAEAEALVVIRRVERTEDYVNERKERAEQYRVEVIVCHSKGDERTGEYYPPFNMTSRAIISKIGDPIEPDEEGKNGRGGAVDGEVIAARIVALGKSKPYPGANTPSSVELGVIEKFYTANGASFDEVGDEKLFATFAAKYNDAKRSSVREQNAKLAGVGAERGSSDGAASDDEPPW